MYNLFAQKLQPFLVHRTSEIDNVLIPSEGGVTLSSSHRKRNRPIPSRQPSTEALDDPAVNGTPVGEYKEVGIIELVRRSSLCSAVPRERDFFEHCIQGEGP